MMAHLAICVANTVVGSVCLISKYIVVGRMSNVGSNASCVGCHNTSLNGKCYVWSFKAINQACLVRPTFSDPHFMKGLVCKEVLVSKKLFEGGTWAIDNHWDVVL